MAHTCSVYNTVATSWLNSGNIICHMLVSDDPAAVLYIQAFFSNRRSNNDFVFALFKCFQHVILLHLCLPCGNTNREH